MLRVVNLNGVTVHGMKAYEEEEAYGEGVAYLHSFVTSTLDGGEC